MTTSQQQSAATPRHLIVCASPAPSSFNHAIVDAYVRAVEGVGQAAIARDLYAMRFDPVLRAEERAGGVDWQPAYDVAVELDLLATCDAVVLVYPIWFGMPPAILKGYLDRVLGADYAFADLHDRRGQPALKGKPLLTFSTSAASLEWLQEQDQPTALRQLFEIYLWRGFGMSRSEHVMIDAVVPSMPQVRGAEQLDRVRRAAERMCALLAGGIPAPIGSPVK